MKLVVTAMALLTAVLFSQHAWAGSCGFSGNKGKAEAKSTSSETTEETPAEDAATPEVHAH